LLRLAFQHSPLSLPVKGFKRTYKLSAFALHFSPTTVAQFGAARLVRHFDGPYEVVGGTPEERADAAEWCAMFAPDAVFSGTPRPNALSTSAILFFRSCWAADAFGMMQKA